LGSFLNVAVFVLVLTHFLLAGEGFVSAKTMLNYDNDGTYPKKKIRFEKEE
jgi:hypothetical protein